MSFLLYKMNSVNGTLEATGRDFQLAGNNIIKKLWEEKGRPLDKGWQITAKDIIRAAPSLSADTDNLHPVSDYHPNADNRIGIVEICDIYLYTFSQDENLQEPEWTPMMLKLRTLYYEKFDTDLSSEEIAAKKQSIKLPPNYDTPTDDSWTFTFLYVKGSSWNFGKPGSANGTFIEGGALRYFRPFFCHP